MDSDPTPDVPPVPPTPPNRRGLVFTLVALGLVVVSAVAGTGLARLLREPPDPPTPPTPLALAGLQLSKWPKPDLALVLTAQMHGYLLPCGCSRPQIGGLERRYNLLEMLKDRGWSLLPLDLGDLAQKEGPARLPNIQGLIKYRYALRALQAMDYRGVGLGEYEAALGCDRLLGEIINLSDVGTHKVPPVLLGNQAANSGYKGLFKDWEMIEAGKIKLAVTAIVGSATEARIKDPALKFTTSAEGLTAISKEMDAKNPDFRVLLYHGSLTRGQFMKGRAAEAVEVAKAFPQFNVVLCLTEEDEPPANPTVVKHANGSETLVVGVGHKGKYAGILGLYRKGTGIETKWDLVHLNEDFLTLAAKEKGHPIVGLMEDYTKELKGGGYLEKAFHIKHPSQLAVPGVTPVYVGSEMCKKCHDSAYDVWKTLDKDKRSHSVAYKTLENARRPSNRQYDPECIVCHTVGYGYESGFRTAEKTPKLKNVGCESCHGPCSEHVKNTGNKAWYPIINPFRPGADETPAQKTKRLGRIDQFLCQKCHDIDNDVTWSNIGFAAKWQKIVHPMPGK